MSGGACVCGETAAFTVWQGGGFRVVECRRCSLKRTEPPPPGGMPSAERAREYVSAYLAAPEEYRFHAAVLIDELLQHVRPGRLLDVGCNVGTLLTVAQERGFAGVGVEINPQAAAVAQAAGLEVHPGALESAGFPAARFGSAILNHTLEHVADPIALLAEVHRVLEPGGALVVGVPAIDGMLAAVRRERWFGLQPREHFWHFEDATLRALLERCGFLVEEIFRPPAYPSRGRGLRGRLRSAVRNAGHRVIGWLGAGDNQVAVAHRPGTTLHDHGAGPVLP